jgi:predicted amidohydrolase
MQQTISRLEKQIPASIAFIGFDCRLVVLPEYFLTGGAIKSGGCRQAIA